MHRALRVFSTALITAGLVVLADVGMTLAWKEPMSTIYGSIKQGQAEDELGDLEGRFPSPADLRALAGVEGAERRARLLADRFERSVRHGEGIGRIRIPAIDLDTVVVEGTDTASLQKGPGHYTTVGDEEGRDNGSAFPGQGRTVGIAGHRTTYLAPFKQIDDLERGDDVVLEMPYATFTYRVEDHEVVEPTEVDVVRDRGYEQLVLTACHPLYSAAQRWVVFARLEEVSLFGAGSGIWQDP